jgi:hypothetical protein
MSTHQVETNLERRIDGLPLLAIEDWKLGKRDMKLYLLAGIVSIPTGRRCRRAQRHKAVQVRQIEAQEALLTGNERQFPALQTTRVSPSHLSDAIPPLVRNGMLRRLRRRPRTATQLILR